MQNTLWPEGAKLYGHGNDLIALAANSDGTLLASSCKASHEMDAHIILWYVNQSTEDIQVVISVEWRKIRACYWQFILISKKWCGGILRYKPG